MAWLEERDLLCRGQMVALMRQGYPQGEALEQALTDTAVQWTIPPPPPTGQKRPLPEENALGRNRTTTNKTSGNLDICKKWNDNRGCRKSEDKCPDGRRHVCDATRPDGRPCESRAHTRKQCRNYAGK